MHGIGSRENVKRRRIFDLLRKLRRGAVAENHVDARLLRERLSDLGEHARQIGGSRHGEVGLLRLPARDAASEDGAHAEPASNSHATSLSHDSVILALLAKTDPADPPVAASEYRSGVAAISGAPLAQPSQLS